MIVTPILEDPFDIGAFPVYVVRDVSTTEFTVAARSASAKHGFAAFDWLAIRETPGVMNQVPDISTGVIHPLFFNPAGQGGTPFPFSHLDITTAAILLTATDQGVTDHSVPAVGALFQRAGDAALLSARNSDLVSGGCAFNWAGLAYGESFSAGSTQPEPCIETGEVGPAWFEPSGQPGDWHTRDIRFAAPFADCPIILVRATKAKETPAEAKPAVVGVVQALTPFGFRLAGRNSDCGKGQTGFNWVGIGQARN